RLVRESGYRMIDLYVHWGFHEEVEGQIDLSSPERDLQRFLDLAHDQGLLVMARPGPYICSETDGGSLPWSCSDSSISPTTRASSSWHGLGPTSAPRPTEGACPGGSTAVARAGGSGCGPPIPPT